ncbi:MAG: carbohydrate ABC transporter permease [Chloroflexi bacterium]|nr:carbohydrate ABC transporter permease [Chloroflexota bacterium]
MDAAAVVTQHREPGRMTVQARIWRLILYTITIVFSLMFMFPFLWTLSSSLKSAQEIHAYPPQLIPQVFRWDNFWTTWTTVEFGPYFLNSIIVTGLSILGGIPTGLLVAYGFARFRFPGREIMFGLCLSTLMLPPEVTFIPLYIVFRNLGWIDTLLPLWVPSFLGGGAFTIFLLRQFVMTIPFELDEAATIDGAGRVRILWSIIVPNSVPALATVAVFSFIAHWNEFFGPLIFLNTRKNFTIPLGLVTLRTYAGDPGEPKDHLLMAGSVIATFPIVIVFFLAQKYFVQGIVTSGLKG